MTLKRTFQYWNARPYHAQSSVRAHCETWTPASSIRAGHATYNHDTPILNILRCRIRIASLRALLRHCRWSIPMVITILADCAPYEHLIPIIPLKTGKKATHLKAKNGARQLASHPLCSSIGPVLSIPAGPNHPAAQTHTSSLPHEFSTSSIKASVSCSLAISKG